MIGTDHVGVLGAGSFIKNCYPISDVSVFVPYLKLKQLLTPLSRCKLVINHDVPEVVSKPELAKWFDELPM